MAGIYIHVPFCRKKCHYCDFYRTTGIEKKAQFLEALKREILLRPDFLEGEAVQTIYWGGGTPSVLSPDEIAEILELLNSHFRMESGQEITLEANPDDVSASYLNHLRQAGINRLSLGIQSLDDQELKLMNRRHSAASAVSSVEEAYRAGFRDISIDLIFGIPGQTTAKWKETLHQTLQWPVNHLSAYHLTYHKGTLFDQWLKKGTIREISEEESISQFEELISMTTRAGFEQYEISNFARNNACSRHNTGYWQGKKYLGLGPSAHSYNGISRSWNVAHLERYVSAVLSGKPAITAEILSEKDRLNDYIITGIRTQWGISLPKIREEYGAEVADNITREIRRLEDRSLVQFRNGTVTLTRGGIMISDQITRDLIME